MSWTSRWSATGRCLPCYEQNLKSLLISYRINPSAVLDFLWACLHKPCLWQEMVKKEAIVNSSISLVSVLCCEWRIMVSFRGWTKIVNSS